MNKMEEVLSKRGEGENQGGEKGEGGED
jgi:hypothetical protein